MKDELEIFERLGVPPSFIVICGVQITDWGGKLRLLCEYGPLEQPFEISFEGCATIYWEHFDVDDEESCIDVIDLQLGQEEYTKEALIATARLEFVLTISYNSMTISKTW